MRAKLGNNIRQSLIVLFSLAAFISIYLATILGIGVDPDSIIYIQGAQNILKGIGFFSISPDGYNAITHFPPVYSFVLSIAHFFISDLNIAARFLSAMIAGLNVLLLGSILNKDIRKSTALFISSIFLLVFTLSVLRVNIWALSEGLFILFTYLAFIYSADYSRKYRRKPLIMAGLMTATAMLTRYFGITVFVTVLVYILFVTTQRVSDKIKNVILYSVTSLLPVILWLLRNAMHATATNRTLASHPIDAERVLALFGTFTQWITSFSISPVANILVLLLLFVLLTYLAVKLHKKQSLKLSAMQKLCMIYIIVFISLLFISISYIDFQTPINTRILSSLYPAFMILLFPIADLFIKQFKYTAVTFAIYVVIIISIALNISGYKWEMMRSRTDGMYYASREWQRSELIKIINAVPAMTVIYSNAPDIIFYYTGRIAYALPQLQDPNSTAVNHAYLEEMKIVNNAIENGALLAYFDKIVSNYLPSKKDLLDTLLIKQVESVYDGVLYGSKDDN